MIIFPVFHSFVFPEVNHYHIFYLLSFLKNLNSSSQLHPQLPPVILHMPSHSFFTLWNLQNDVTSVFLLWTILPKIFLPFPFWTGSSLNFLCTWHKRARWEKIIIFEVNVKSVGENIGYQVGKVFLWIWISKIASIFIPPF